MSDAVLGQCDFTSYLESRREFLDREAHRRWVQLLRDGKPWLSMETYVPSKDYVHVFGEMAWGNCAVIVARRGWKANSGWWYVPPHGESTVWAGAWRPLPEGADPYREHDLLCDREKWVRPWPDLSPPAVAAGPDHRLTPAPVALLTAMREGAVLVERVWTDFSYRLHRAGAEPERVNGRARNLLEAAGFIARTGEIPTAWPREGRSHRIEWVVTPAGAAWLEANAR